MDTPAEEAAEEVGEGNPGSADETPAVDTPAEEAAEEVGEEVLKGGSAGGGGVTPKAAAPAPKEKAGPLPSTGGLSPMVLVSVAILVSGAAIGVVALRRLG